MDINLAKSLIENLTKSRTDELATLVLAQSILNDTFQAEFTNRDNAVAEATDSTAKLNAEKVARTQDVATLTSEKDALETAYNNTLAEKDTLITESVAKDTQIADLQAQIVTLTPKEVPLEVVVK